MNHTLRAFFLSLLTMTFLVGKALPAPNSELQVKRIQVIKQYLLDLQNGNADEITKLFEQKGFVFSTSKGIVEAGPFFHAFLPQIKYAFTELNQLFLNPNDENRIAIRFRYHFELKNGERNYGQYMDEFVFEKNTDKLLSVYMFENLKIS